MLAPHGRGSEGMPRMLGINPFPIGGRGCGAPSNDIYDSSDGHPSAESWARDRVSKQRTQGAGASGAGASAGGRRSGRNRAREEAREAAAASTKPSSHRYFVTTCSHSACKQAIAAVIDTFTERERIPDDDSDPVCTEARRAGATLVEAAGRAVRFPFEPPPALRGLNSQELSVMQLVTCVIRGRLTIMPWIHQPNRKVRDSDKNVFSNDSSEFLAGSDIGKPRDDASVEVGAFMTKHTIARSVRNQLQRSDQYGDAQLGVMTSMLTDPSVCKDEYGIRPAKVIHALVFLTGYSSLPFVTRLELFIRSYEDKIDRLKLLKAVCAVYDEVLTAGADADGSDRRYPGHSIDSIRAAAKYFK